jgi:hypothetical protein
VLGHKIFNCSPFAEHYLAILWLFSRFLESHTAFDDHGLVIRYLTLTGQPAEIKAYAGISLSIY